MIWFWLGIEVADAGGWLGIDATDRGCCCCWRGIEDLEIGWTWTWFIAILFWDEFEIWACEPWGVTTGAIAMFCWEIPPWATIFEVEITWPWFWLGKLVTLWICWFDCRACWLWGACVTGTLIGYWAWVCWIMIGCGTLCVYITWLFMIWVGCDGLTGTSVTKFWLLKTVVFDLVCSITPIFGLLLKLIFRVGTELEAKVFLA